MNRALQMLPDPPPQFRVTANACGAGVTPCGARPARFYPCGWRCHAHQPGHVPTPPPRPTCRACNRPMGRDGFARHPGCERPQRSPQATTGHSEGSGPRRADPEPHRRSQGLARIIPFPTRTTQKGTA